MSVLEVNYYWKIHSRPPHPKKNPNENGDSTEPENAELFHFTDIHLTCESPPQLDFQTGLKMQMQRLQKHEVLSRVHDEPAFF